VFDGVTTVPAATFDLVGAGKLNGPADFQRQKLTGAPYTSNGKPVVLTGNLAWCPHCAANNWGLAVALSRFGTFATLRTIDTGTYYASFPHTRGISFFGVKYTSDLLVFQHVVVEDVNGKSLQKPTKAQAKALKFAGGYPAVNVGGVYGTSGSGYGPGALKKKSAATIAAALADPTTPLAKRIDGLANFYSAAICKVTGGMPADVCTSVGVTAAGSGLPA
jgi:hypothetical protein